MAYESYDPTPRPARPLADCSDDEIDRWNREWLDYLGREWAWQLAPHTAFPGSPPLPDDPLAMLEHRVAGWPLSLYCHREALLGRRVMEVGCGCGNLGKLLGRYTAAYLGVDFSTLALQVARLVSPENCHYLHVRDVAAHRTWHGTIDTVVSRFFWIHQNHEMGRHVLAFLAEFLRSGGSLYADFYSPGGRKPGIELRPEDSLLAAHPSALFCYDERAIECLVEGLPFRLERVEPHPATERRYAIFTRL